MAFLEINGLALPIQAAQKNYSSRGRRDDSARGMIRDTRRGHRETWRLDVCSEDWAFITALERYVEGQGHFFDLNDGVQASTGLQLAPGYAGLRPRPDLTGAFGNPGHFETLAVGQVACIDAQFDDLSWGLAWWEDTGGGWITYGRTWDGRGFEAGIRDDDVGDPLGGTSALAVRVVEGVMYLQNEGGAGVGIDDIVPLLFSPTDPYFVAWAALTVPHSQLPLLRITGSMIEDQMNVDEAWAFGRVADSKFMKQGVKVDLAPDSTEFVQNGKQLSFMLDFVTDAYARDQVVRT